MVLPTETPPAIADPSTTTNKEPPSQADLLGQALARIAALEEENRAFKESFLMQRTPPPANTAQKKSAVNTGGNDMVSPIRRMDLDDSDDDVETVYAETTPTRSPRNATRATPGVQASGSTRIKTSAPLPRLSIPLSGKKVSTAANARRARRNVRTDVDEKIPVDVARRLEDMEDLIRYLPGVPAPLRKSSRESFADTPFIDEIAVVDLPRRFVAPRFRVYDGTSDPDDHVAHYRQAMLTTSIPRESREACFCKFFGNSLSGPALEWYINLPNSSIESFAQLTDSFVENFACSRKPERQADDLYAIRQKHGE